VASKRKSDGRSLDSVDNSGDTRAEPTCTLRLKTLSGVVLTFDSDQVHLLYAKGNISLNSFAPRNSVCFYLENLSNCPIIDE